MPITTLHLTNTSIIDASGGTEIARLMNQSLQLTYRRGGVFPGLTGALPSQQNVLDLACGPGRWILDVAHASPQITVVDVDIDPSLGRYARAQPWSHGLNNVTILVIDITRPFDVPENAFDLVHARLPFGVLLKDAWPLLLQECERILRRMTEVELPLCTSCVGEQMSVHLAQALPKAGRSLSPNGRTIGMTPVLGTLFHDAGLEHIEQQSHALEFSVGTEFYAFFCENGLVGARLLKPFSIDPGIIAEEAFEVLYRQASRELRSPNFCGLWIIQSAWGRKPQEGVRRGERARRTRENAAGKEAV